MMMAIEQLGTLFYPSATPSSFNPFTHNFHGGINYNSRNYNNNDLFLDPSSLFDDQINLQSTAHCYDTNGISNLFDDQTNFQSTAHSYDTNGISNLFNDQTNLQCTAHSYDANGISNLLLCQPVVDESFDQYLTPAPLDTVESFLGYPPRPDYTSQWPLFQEQQQQAIMNDFYTPLFESPSSSSWSEQQ
jgi:hypothetical protein